MGGTVKLVSVPGFENLEVVKTGIISVSYSLGTPQTDESSITHGLGYTPIFLAYFVGNGSPAPSYPYTSGIYQLPHITSWNDSGASEVINGFIAAKATPTTFTVYFSHTSGETATSPIYVRYYLMKQLSTN